MPYFKPRKPPALVATFPPIVETVFEPGSGTYIKPSLATASSSCCVETPGCTTAKSSFRETSRICFICIMLNTMPPCNGTVAAHKLLPAPRAIIGVFDCRANLTTSLTSAVECGVTITSGNPLNKGVASRLYASRAAGSSSTRSGPRRVRRACAKGVSAISPPLKYP
ncbi:unannotated protein [freshwater metagenome]|uniref:Unannotated protein n=1 Tax=freshwater metagenome TaxID=449393 RepID=A0A6J6CYZ3_9ZZZZ